MKYTLANAQLSPLVPTKMFVKVFLDSQDLSQEMPEVIKLTPFVKITCKHLPGLEL